MLATLKIRDLVLIEDVSLDFAPGLNVLTGETGAGKSILLDALGLAAGARAGGRSSVRSGALQGSAVAIFDLPPDLPANRPAAMVPCARPRPIRAPVKRKLRERHGFKGELRATGQVLRDQFMFMLRAGFDAFEVKKEADAEAFANTAKRYSVFYQPTGDGRLTALHQRMQLRHSESASQ